MNLLFCCHQGKEEEAVEGRHKIISNKELLESETDILIPSALENQITADNAGKIKAKVILEMANGPVTAEADEILKSIKELEGMFQ